MPRKKQPDKAIEPLIQIQPSVNYCKMKAQRLALEILERGKKT